MPFDWNDYYSLAVDLRASPNEDCLRSAISRVYYSVYCQARNYLIAQCGLVIRDNNSVHSVVWNFYKTRGGTFSAIGLTGRKLHSNRVDADYKDELERLDDLVEESFQFADKVLSYLAQLQHHSSSDPSS